ncbi:MAG: hypothetical protein GXP15_16990 [Gammaproteobacteria bacterium]|nr:hypothetical protein [Gammaproteobacteria bacterium]
MNTNISLLVLLSLVLSGCTAPELLLRKSHDAPSNETLPGQWIMLENIDNAKRDLDRAIRATNDVDEKKENRRFNSAQKKGDHAPRPVVGGLVHVFLKNGKMLKITRTETGLFISFDRSIVEEYHFGEARTISVGAVRAQRVSGWEGDQFVVETLDDERMKLTERYQVLDNGSRLRRQITFRSKQGEEVTNVQTFRRD